MLSLTEMFASLGAPLANQRWSWGAERRSDGAVFLRVWQDECAKIVGRRAVRITANALFADEPDNLGNSERLRHVDLIRSGRQVYLVMCVAVDAKVEPRTIAQFNDKEVFVGGALFDHQGDAWVELASRKPLAEVRVKPGIGGERNDMAASWAQDEVFPIIARVITSASAGRSDYLSSQEIAELLLRDSEGQGAIESAQRGLPKERTPEWVASNMVAWFSQKITEGQSDWANQFDRTKQKGVWAYRRRI